MLIPRVIPCLLLSDGVFVKTERFKNPVYIGDPVNTINLFNRFEVDEIVVLDIGATPKRQSIRWDILEPLASECWVPLAYGGGIQTLEDIQRIITLGVEKVVLNSVLHTPGGLDLIRAAANQFGSQAIVASLDVKTNWLGKPEVVTHHATKVWKGSPADIARQVEQAGAGEIFLNSVDLDGTFAGYNVPLIRSVTQAVTIPVIACGGAGKRHHLIEPLAEGGASAVAAGSLFVYQGSTRGVLVNFPERDVLESLLAPLMALPH
ncbi:MAG: AglZ/HisF2 family acetamidino modification protein [Vampirovibrionales bacterium]|nr:AglZ/HisF2 family acetamidino modification protein [Vampirovibrionales bacterium]